MPLLVDIHKSVEGLTVEAVVEAHKKNLETQDKHGVKYLRYWFNEDEGTVFCLFEAPNAEAGAAVHDEAHGGVADKSRNGRPFGSKKCFHYGRRVFGFVPGHHLNPNSG